MQLSRSYEYHKFRSMKSFKHFCGEGRNLFWFLTAVYLRSQIHAIPICLRTFFAKFHFLTRFAGTLFDTYVYLEATNGIYKVHCRWDQFFEHFCGKR